MKWLIIFLLYVSSIVNAQTIDFVVTATAGGPNDVVTRKIVEQIEKETSLRFVIINKPGAAHTIGYRHVLESDKPTLVMSTPEIKHHEVYEKVEELFNAGYFTNTLFVSRKSGISDITQLIELTNKRDINFGHGGVGSYSYSAMEYVCASQLRNKCLYVGYKSGANGILGVMTGEIDAYALASYGSSQFLNNDKLTAIHEIRVGRDRSWFKLFSKGVSAKDKETIISVMKAQPFKFYSDMGFEK